MRNGLVLPDVELLCEPYFSTSVSYCIVPAFDALTPIFRGIVPYPDLVESVL